MLTEDYSGENAPNLNDLRKHTEAGLLKRGIARYLFSQNPERSVKVLTFLGAPVIRKTVLKVFSLISDNKSKDANQENGYFLDKSKPRLDASMNFAVNGSVFNELWHTTFASYSLDCILEGRLVAFNSVAVGFNLALVGLQRYNRARMAIRVNEELQAGQQFEPNYRNWLGLDATAYNNYQLSLLNDQSDQI